MSLRRGALTLVAAAVAVSACAAGVQPAPSTLPSTSSTVPPPSVPAGTTTEVLDLDGRERSYQLTVPPSVPVDAPVALVIDMHGLGSNPTNQEWASGWAEKAAAGGFVVAQPRARGAIPTWNAQPGTRGAALDVSFLRAIIADVGTKVAVDPGRVFASGFSNGGGMAHRIACEAADLVAAIGTVAGQYVALDQCSAASPVAVITFHGTSDVIVPYRGAGEMLPDVPTWAQAWADRNACGPVPEREWIAGDVVRDRWSGCAGDVAVELYTIDEGPHAWPGSERPGVFVPSQSVDATDLMWDFFVSHARS